MVYQINLCCFLFFSESLVDLLMNTPTTAVYRSTSPKKNLVSESVSLRD